LQIVNQTTFIFRLEQIQIIVMTLQFICIKTKVVHVSRWRKTLFNESNT